MSTEDKQRKSAWMKDANKSRKMSLRDDFSEECISPDISHPEAMLQFGIECAHNTPRKSTLFSKDANSMIQRKSNIYNMENARIAKRNTSRIRTTLTVNAWLIYPDDLLKDIWGLVMTLMLLYSTIATPYKVAFYDEEPIGWLIADILVDLFFVTDIVLHFFTVYYDENQDLVTDKKAIALKYIKSYFFLDCIACIPFHLFVQNNGTKNYGSLVRLLRIPRLYRLIRITKLLRIIRQLRDRKSIKQAPTNWLNIEKYLKMGASAERLITFSLVYFILCHVSACLFYLLAKLEGIYPDTWVVILGYQDSTNFELYTASFYYTISTITTVGYGDITPQTKAERWFSVFLLLLGGTSYSFAISSISSWLSASDARNQRQKEELNALDCTDLAYNLSSEMYMKLRKIIILRNRAGQISLDTQDFINGFPKRIRTELSAKIHTSELKKIHKFNQMSHKFVVAVAKEIKVLKKQKDEYIYRKGDDLNGIYFIAKGRVEIVLPEFHNRPFVQITKGHEFGELDFLENITRREFTVRAAHDCELLWLRTEALHSLMEIYYKEVMKFFSQSEQKLDNILDLQDWMTQKLKSRAIRLSRKLETAISTAKSRQNTRINLEELKDEGGCSSLCDSMSIFSDISEEMENEDSLYSQRSGKQEDICDETLRKIRSFRDDLKSNDLPSSHNKKAKTMERSKFKGHEKRGNPRIPGVVPRSRKSIHKKNTLKRHSEEMQLHSNALDKKDLLSAKRRSSAVQNILGFGLSVDRRTSESPTTTLQESPNSSYRIIESGVFKKRRTSDKFNIVGNVIGYSPPLKQGTEENISQTEEESEYRNSQHSKDSEESSHEGKNVLGRVTDSINNPAISSEDYEEEKAEDNISCIIEGAEKEIDKSIIIDE